MGNARTVGQAVLAYMADNGTFSATNGSTTLSTSGIGELTDYIVARVANPNRGWAGLPRCPMAQTNKAVGGGYSISYNLLSYYPTLANMPFSASRAILVSEDNNAYMYNNAMIRELTGTMWGVSYDRVPSGDAGTYAALKAIEGKNYTPQYHGDATNRALNMFMADGSAALVKSGSNCNFYFAPTHANVSNGVPAHDGYIFEQMYYIINRATITYPE